MMQAGTIQDHIAGLFAKVKQLEADMAEVKASLAEMAVAMADLAGAKPKGKGSD